MRFPRIAFLGVFSLCVGVGAACSSASSPAVSSASTGTGGTTVASSTHASSSTGRGTGGEIPDASTDGPDIGQPSAKYPAPFATPPQVITFDGPVLASPRFVPVFFSNDDATTVGQLQDFISKIGATAYWATAVGEYGVGPATATTPINLTETAPATIDDTAIQTWLEGKLNGNDPLWPANDANTVYVLHYPSTTTITLSGSSSCQSFGGYHSDTNLDGNHGNAFVSYAVVPRCASFGALMGIDAVTGAESHELAEASTDPYPEPTTLYPNANPAYAQVDDEHLFWERTLGGGEVGDMCAQFPQAFTKFPELDYTVQRIWSNKAAMAGHDPCQPPFPDEGSYYNGAPNLTDNVTVNFEGSTISYKGVEIGLGETKTIDIDLFSDGPMPAPFDVQVVDFASLVNPMAPADLDITLDADKGLNGQKIHATITVKTAGHRGTETFLVVTSNGGTTDSAQNQNWWIGIVGTPVDAGPTGSSSGGFSGPTSSSSSSSSSSSTSGAGGASGTGGADGG